MDSLKKLQLAGGKTRIDYRVMLYTIGCVIVMANAQNDTGSSGTSQNQVIFNDEGVQICAKTEDCLRPPFYICDEEKLTCKHKDIFPIYELEFIGVMILPVLLGMANVGGIGGGGIIIPCLMTAWGFETKQAIAISNITIFVGAVLRFICTYSQMHPEKPEAVGLDYGIAIVMMPLVLVGSFSGVLINLWLSDLILGIILTCLLIFLTVQSARSAVKIYKKESAMLKKGIESGKKTLEKIERDDAKSYLADVRFADNDEDQHPEFESNQDQKAPYIEVSQEPEGKADDESKAVNGDNSFSQQQLVSAGNSTQPNTNPEAQNPAVAQEITPVDQASKKEQSGTEMLKINKVARAQSNSLGNSTAVYGIKEQEPTPEDFKKLEIILKAESSHVGQWRKHLFSLVVTLTALAVTFMRGSKKFDSIIGIPKCGALDWSLVAGLVVVMFLLTALGVHINKQEQALKRKCRKGMVASDIQFKGRQLFILCFFAFVGGWVSGALGLGGGSIFNPLMISLGVPPLVSTSTGMYMIMFSTAASSTIYIAYGAMDMQFAAWLCFWACAGILSGIWAVNTLMKRYKRQSILVMVLVSVLGMATLSVPIQTFFDAKLAYENGKPIWATNSIC